MSDVKGLGIGKEVMQDITETETVLMMKTCRYDTRTLCVKGAL